MADLARIAEIYAEQVRTAVSTFDLELGYAYSSSYRPRPAYDRTREVSVYLDPRGRGRGLGRVLYDELLDRLRADGVHLALAVIAQPNEASEALHRACGFERLGLLPEVGFKLGRWVDTALWGLRLP